MNKTENLRKVLNDLRTRMRKVRRISDSAAWDTALVHDMLANGCKGLYADRVLQNDTIILRCNHELERLERLYAELTDKYTCLMIQGM